MRAFRIFIYVIALGVLAGCGPRPTIMVDRSAPGVGKVHPIFVGTTRQPEDGVWFGSDRAGELQLARFDISVPPSHESGNIEWPRRTPDPLKHFLASDLAVYSDAADFQGQLRNALRARPSDQRLAVVYIHGFNNTFADGVYRLAQMTHDYELPDIAVHYSWPSAGNPLGYGFDRDSVLFARDGLEELLGLVDNAGANQILLVGHSLGAHLVMETLRQMAIADPQGFDQSLAGVVLISPDIDVDLFRQQSARIGDLPQPFAIFSSDRDRALRLSAKLTGQTDRLGTVTNPETLSDLEVTIFDVSEFSDGPVGHFSTATSPALIRILNLLPGIEAAFANDPSGRSGLITGTVLTVRNATKIILSPVSLVAEQSG